MTDAPWLLLVEDDAIFAMLFSRVFKARCSRYQLKLAKSLAEARALIDGSTGMPALMIIDRILPDGDGSSLAASVNVPNLCWSADGDGGFQMKPQGKAALEQAVTALLSAIPH